jgi:hypothetical protein
MSGQPGHAKRERRQKYGGQKKPLLHLAGDPKKRDKNKEIMNGLDREKKEKNDEKQTNNR